jgi:hypothetical protein
MPNTIAIDLSLVPNLADHLFRFILDRLQAGLEWKLKALVVAYSGLTEHGLYDLETLLRVASDTLKYIVVSGVHPDALWTTLCLGGHRTTLGELCRQAFMSA